MLNLTMVKLNNGYTHYAEPEKPIDLFDKNILSMVSTTPLPIAEFIEGGHHPLTVYQWGNTNLFPAESNTKIYPKIVRFGSLTYGPFNYGPTAYIIDCVYYYKGSPNLIKAGIDYDYYTGINTMYLILKYYYMYNWLGISPWTDFDTFNYSYRERYNFSPAPLLPYNIRMKILKQFNG